MSILVEIREFLIKKFELSDKEAELYLFLVKNGPSTVLEVSEATGIKRSTVHVNLESLLQKNLIKQVHKGQGSRRIIIAEPPEKLALILENRKSELAMTEKQLPAMIEKLSGLTKESQHPGMEVRYYRGKDEVRFIYEEALKAKEFRAYSNCEQLEKTFPHNIEKFLETHAKRKNLEIWEIMEDSLHARNYSALTPKERYHCRLIPKYMNSRWSVIDYMIFDDQVAIVDLEQGASGTLIHNNSYYENAKAVFELTWQFLKPYKE